MLITHENILDCFSENLEWATRIDLATAWATTNRSLYALYTRRRFIKARTIVGFLDNITEPDALRKLFAMGKKLRMADERRRFHPKVYIFRGTNKSVAWIGSANFTCRGFGGNEEVLFETSNTEAVGCWFNQLWEECYPLDESDIHDYEAHRRKNPSPQRSTKWTPPTLNMRPRRLLEEVDDWRSYVTALERCNRWWKRSSRKHYPSSPWSVLGMTESWSNTIRELHKVVKKDWIELSDCNRRRLRGLGGAQWALLGGLGRVREERLFGSNRKKIQKILHGMAANDAVSLDEAIVAYESLRDQRDGEALVGEATATRLLALARPDRFVSLNDGSRNGLAAFFGLSPSTLGTTQKYGCLLEKIYNLPWIREPAPQSEREQLICGMRVALFDCFVYKDMGNK